MSGARSGAADRDARLLDGVLVGVVVGLVIWSVVAFLLPVAFTGVVSASLDLVIHTVASVVTISVAVLAGVRYRQGGEPGASFEAAAFLVLAMINVATVVLITLGIDRVPGLLVSSPFEAPLNALTIVRVFAAALLVTGSVAALRSWRVRRGAAIVLGSVAATLVFLVVFLQGAEWLPALWVTGDAGALTGGSGVPGPFAPPTPFGAAVQVIGAALFLLAAGLSRRLYRRDGMPGGRYLAIGLVFAAFAQVQPTFHPGTYTGLVTSDDLLRVVFDIVLLAGLQAQASAHSRQPPAGQRGDGPLSRGRRPACGVRGASPPVARAPRRPGAGPLGREAQVQAPGRASRTSASRRGRSPTSSVRRSTPGSPRPSRPLPRFASRARRSAHPGCAT